MWCYDQHEAAERLHVEVPTVIPVWNPRPTTKTRLLNKLLDEAEFRIT